jgi:hypothetical protein
MNNLQPRVDQMRQSIEVYRALIELHGQKIETLRRRRHDATDSMMVEIDQRLEAHERLVGSLRRAIEATELQVRALQNSAG